MYVVIVVIEKIMRSKDQRRGTESADDRTVCVFVSVVWCVCVCVCQPAGDTHRVCVCANLRAIHMCVCLC